MRVAVSAWVGLVCLLLVAFDGIPDAEQFSGILVVAGLSIAGIERSADLRRQRNVAVSLSPLFAYLAFLLRSPPAASALRLISTQRETGLRASAGESSALAQEDLHGELREQVGCGGTCRTDSAVPCGKRRDSRGGRKAHRVRHGTLGRRYERQLSTRRVGAREDR